MIWDFFTFIRGFSEFSATALLMLFGCMGDSMNQGDENKSLVARYYVFIILLRILNLKFIPLAFTTDWL